MGNKVNRLSPFTVLSPSIVAQLAFYVTDDGQIAVNEPNNLAWQLIQMEMGNQRASIDTQARVLNMLDDQDAPIKIPFGSVAEWMCTNKDGQDDYYPVAYQDWQQFYDIQNSKIYYKSRKMKGEVFDGRPLRIEGNFNGNIEHYGITYYDAYGEEQELSKEDNIVFLSNGVDIVPINAYSEDAKLYTVIDDEDRKIGDLSEYYKKCEDYINFAEGDGSSSAGSTAGGAAQNGLLPLDKIAGLMSHNVPKMQDAPQMVPAVSYAQIKVALAEVLNERLSASTGEDAYDKVKHTRSALRSLVIMTDGVAAEWHAGIKPGDYGRRISGAQWTYVKYENQVKASGMMGSGGNPFGVMMPAPYRNLEEVFIDGNILTALDNAAEKVEDLVTYENKLVYRYVDTAQGSVEGLGGIKGDFDNAEKSGIIVKGGKGAVRLRGISSAMACNGNVPMSAIEVAQLISQVDAVANSNGLIGYARPVLSDILISLTGAFPIGDITLPFPSHDQSPTDFVDRFSLNKQYEKDKDESSVFYNYFVTLRSAVEGIKGKGKPIAGAKGANKEKFEKLSSTNVLFPEERDVEAYKDMYAKAHKLMKLLDKAREKGKAEGKTLTVGAYGYYTAFAEYLKTLLCYNPETVEGTKFAKVMDFDEKYADSGYGFGSQLDPFAYGSVNEVGEYDELAEITLSEARDLTPDDDEVMKEALSKPMISPFKREEGTKSTDVLRHNVRVSNAVVKALVPETDKEYSGSESAAKAVERRMFGYSGESAIAQAETTSTVDYGKDIDRNSKEYKEVEKAFSSAITERVNHIIQEMEWVYASGYDMGWPVCLFISENQVCTKVDGKMRVLSVGDEGYRVFYQKLYKEVESVFSNSETVYENGYAPVDYPNMRNAILSAFVSGGHKTPFFPKYQFRIAYGYSLGEWVSVDPISWGAYSGGMLSDSMRTMLTDLVYQYASVKGLLRDNSYKSESNSSTIHDLIDYAQESLLKTLFVADYNSIESEGREQLASLRIKALIPGSTASDRDRMQKEFKNGVDRALSNNFSEMTVSSSESQLRFNTSKSKYGSDLTFVADVKLDNAMPLFAYKALQAKQKQNPNYRLDISNAILGKDEDGHILTASDGMSLNNALTHYCLARSRAGKGVFTLNVLAAAMSGDSYIAYADSKPDMASLIKKLNPNAPVLNGVQWDDSAGGNGANMYHNFNANQKMSEVLGWGNIPQYLFDQGVLVKNMGGAQGIGVISYLKYMTLLMSMIIARIGVKDPAIREKLGGDKGWVFVFDEFANTTKIFVDTVNKWRGTKLYPSTAVLLDTAKKASKEDNMTFAKYVEENMETCKRTCQGALWVGTFLYSLIQTELELKVLQNAGGADEALLSNIFVLGQEPVRFGDNSINYMADNAAGVSDLNPDRLRNFMSSLCTMGSSDGFLGYSEKKADFLCQFEEDSKAHDFLNETVRGFGYVEGIDGNMESCFKMDGIGKKSSASDAERKNFPNLAGNVKYFKPYLLLASSDMQGEYSYPVQKMISNILAPYSESEKEEKRKAFIRANQDENDPTKVNKALGFEGLVAMSLGADMAQAQTIMHDKLQMSTDSLNFFVQEMMGYPGTWEQLVYDFRPEWFFNGEDVYNMVGKGSLEEMRKYFTVDRITNPQGNPAKYMFKYFPECKPDASVFGEGATGGYSGEDTLDGFGSSDVESFQSQPLDEENYTADSKGILTSIVTQEFMSRTAQALNATGGICEVEVNRNGVKINGEVFTTRESENPSTKILWNSVLSAGNISALFTTKKYLDSYILYAFDLTPSEEQNNYQRFFSKVPRLETLVVDGYEFFSEVKQPPIPAPAQPDANDAPTTMLPAQGKSNRMLEEYGPQRRNPVNTHPVPPDARGAGYSEGRNSTQSSLVNKMLSWLDSDKQSAQGGNSQPSAAAQLISAGYSRGKRSFKNGGLVRKGAAAGLALTGASLLTGGLSTSLLMSLAAFPPAWGAAAVLAAVKLAMGPEDKE